MNSQRQGYEGWWQGGDTVVGQADTVAGQEDMGIKKCYKIIFYVEFVHLYRCIFSVSI
jgi:hypothetical protein